MYNIYAEKDLVLDLIRTGMSTEEIVVQNPAEDEQILSASSPLPPPSRVESKLEERKKHKDEHRHCGFN